MPDLLFLAHRIPYPPDKGDKIRSWNFLQHLAKNYRVHLGCFVDDERDRQFELPLRELCEQCCFRPLVPRVARWRSGSALWRGLPLTLPYYFDRALERWVRRLLEECDVTTVFAYCSAMAQYIPRGATIGKVVDLVDLDSQKWREYARTETGPKRWILNREGRRLLEFEQKVARYADAVLLATRPEAVEFAALAPSAADRIHAIRNGVDTDYFSPDRVYENPYAAAQKVVVFTGAMDYRPNVDAVTYFLREVFPSVRAGVANAALFIVGANPTAELLSLADGERVFVTGRVADVRPYIAHSSVVIAPLRVARGIQNKVLEGMAMGKPVVASREAITGIDADIRTDVLVADSPEAFAGAICEHALIDEKAKAVGISARQRMLSDYSWSNSFRLLDHVLSTVPTESSRDQGTPVGGLG